MTDIFLCTADYRAPPRLDVRRGVCAPSEVLEDWMAAHREIGVQPEVLEHYLRCYREEMLASCRMHRSKWDELLTAKALTLVCSCQDALTCHRAILGSYILVRLGCNFVGERELRRREDLRGHHCHAEGCDEKVPPERLMCLKHWRMVPRDMQREVWQTYREGQCYDMQVSREYLFAARRAVVYVAQIEGRVLPGGDAMAAFDAAVPLGKRKTPAADVVRDAMVQWLREQTKHDVEVHAFEGFEGAGLVVVRWRVEDGTLVQR